MTSEMESMTQWLFDLTKFGEKNGLGNIRELLRRLGDPQDSFRSVHVAGSDGKGSTCSLIYSVLRAAGIHAGLYTSPHILRVNERVVVDGEEITDDEFLTLAYEIRDAVDAMRKDGFACTFFEAMTALGFLHFKRKGVEYAVVEVGMGGRFDATNVLIPEVSVICNISLEHTQFLGNTIEEIAFEKAGIIKPGVPSVTCNTGASLGVIAKVAAERNSELRCIGEHETVSEDGTGSVIRYGGRKYRVGIPGSFQCINAAMALEAVSLLSAADRLSPFAEQGLADARWKCRMQKIDGMPLVIDVTHTAAGMDALSHDAVKLYGKTVTVFGVLDDKDVETMSAFVAEMSDWVIVTAPDSARALDPEKTFSVMKRNTCRCELVPTVSAAAETAMKKADGRTVLVTGSFAMAEDALKWLSSGARVLY